MNQAAAETKAIHLLKTTSLFYPQISRRTGLAVNYISKLKRRHNLRTLTDDEQRRNREHWQKYDDAANLVANGLSVRMAAEQHGLTEGMVRSGCRTRQISTQQPSRSFCIYALCCPVTGVMRYVGASANPRMRLYSHVCEPVSFPMRKWIAECKRQRTKPSLKILAMLNEPNWRQIEKQWIRKLLNEGHPLLNEQR